MLYGSQDTAQVDEQETINSSLLYGSQEMALPVEHKPVTWNLCCMVHKMLM